MTDTSTSKPSLVRVGRLLAKGIHDADEHRYVLASDYEKLERELAELRGKLDAPAPTPAPLERDEWTPRQALEFYAAGRHFDVVNGRTRILDTGAIASDALKQLSPGYAQIKGLPPAPATAPGFAPWPEKPTSNVSGLLADMRRKYLHAREKAADGNWLKGEPITTTILESWIPQVEALQLVLETAFTREQVDTMIAGDAAVANEPPACDNTPTSKRDLIEFFEDFLWATEGEGSKAARGVDWSCAINVAKKLLTQLQRVGEPPARTDTPTSKQALVDALIAAAARRAANGVHNQDLYEAESAARNAVLLALEPKVAPAYGCRNCDETFSSLVERNAHQTSCSGRPGMVE